MPRPTSHERRGPDHSTANRPIGRTAERRAFRDAAVRLRALRGRSALLTEFRAGKGRHVSCRTSSRKPESPAKAGAPVLTVQTSRSMSRSAHSCSAGQRESSKRGRAVSSAPGRGDLGLVGESARKVDTGPRGAAGGCRYRRARSSGIGQRFAKPEGGRDARRSGADMQIFFQDPLASLNPP